MATKAPFDVFGTTPIWHREADNAFLGIIGADIDGDGSGGNLENDPDFQATTTYKPDQNSRITLGIVMPMRFIRNVPGVVIGCLARLTHIQSGEAKFVAVLDAGPDDKFGEVFIAVAKAFGVPSSPVTGGTNEPIFLCEVWPGKAAPGFTLQPYKG